MPLEMKESARGDAEVFPVGRSSLQSGASGVGQRVAKPVVHQKAPEQMVSNLRIRAFYSAVRNIDDIRMTEE
jgi:hypothetical protein